MKPVAYLTALAAALLLVSGCAPKPASEVNKDVDKAASQAQQKQADANASVADTVTAAKSDVRDQEKDSQHQIAGAEADAATVKAKGDHKVALTKCEGLTGSAHDACKARADADYDASIATIKQQKATHDPKP
jgi:hypothetical protein